MRNAWIIFGEKLQTITDITEIFKNEYKINWLVHIVFFTMQQGSNWQEVSPPPLLGEQQVVKGLSIDAAVIAAVPYLHSTTTFHLISMTFHRQPLVPGPSAGEGERKSERGALDNTQLTPPEHHRPLLAPHGNSSLSLYLQDLT